MSRPTIDRLRDILQSADLAARHAKGLDAESLAVAAPLRDATLFQIVLIGEAVSRLPDEIQSLEPEIPWSDIRNMRNIIVHSYWQVDFRTVVSTIENDLEPLKAATRRLIEVVLRGAE